MSTNNYIFLVLASGVRVTGSVLSLYPALKQKVDSEWTKLVYIVDSGHLSMASSSGDCIVLKVLVKMSC